MNNELLILVDDRDNEIGTASKIDAHEHGLLHRAFSVFIFNTKGEFLLQQRARGKYHSAGLWSNTCCSHPAPGENVAEAAKRRLFEEMGMRCKLTKLFSFVYRAEMNNGLIEHELDHVFVGISDDKPAPDPLEVEAWKYLQNETLQKEIRIYREQYTEWFRIIMNKYSTDITAVKNLVICG